METVAVNLALLELAEHLTVLYGPDMDGCDTVSAKIWLSHLGVNLTAMIRHFVVRPVLLTKDPWTVYNGMVMLWGYTAVINWDQQLDGANAYGTQLMRLRVEQHGVVL